LKPASRADGPLAPAFDAPWQAQIYAMFQVLIESGVIKVDIWAAPLGASIIRRQSASADDTVEEYFLAVGDALMSVLPVETTEISETMDPWRSAYEATPHGKPVLLLRGHAGD
jgi:hypothetical protein